jgi:hypothetical protein
MRRAVARRRPGYRGGRRQLTLLRLQKLNDRKKTKGIKLDRKKKDDDIVISLGPLDRVRCVACAAGRAACR